MGLVSRDPNGKPEITNEMAHMAATMHWHIYQVICDPQGARVGDTGGISFVACGPTIPHVGEIIYLENKKRCIIKKVCHSVRTQDKVITMHPLVYAVLEEKPSDMPF